MNGQPSAYAFVDLGYLFGELESLGQFVLGDGGLRPEINALRTMLRPLAAGSYLRVFIYYAAEEKPATPEREAKQSATVAWLGKLQRAADVHVRWGDLRFRPRGGGRVQKRVDVMLAVDMMKHAFRGTIEHAILVAGDLDFQPLVQEVVESGCRVTVAAARGRSAAAELLDAADHVLDLDSVSLFNVGDHGLPSITRTGVQGDSRCRFVASGPRGRAWLGDLGGGSGLAMVSFGDPPVQNAAWAHHHTDPRVMKRLALYEIGCTADAWSEPNKEEAVAFSDLVATLR